MTLNTRGQGGTLVWMTDRWLITDVTELNGGVVANKPYLVARWTQESGHPGDLLNATTGWNDLILNEMPENDIPGASLSSNEITLPAGTYYVKAVHSGGRTDTNLPALRKVSDDSVLLRGVNHWSDRVNANVLGQKGYSGRITLTETTVVKTSTWIKSDDTYALGIAGSVDGLNEVYAEIEIWKLDTEIKKITVQDPQQYLKKPLLHVQDQKPTGTGGGTSVSGDNERPLNTVLTNEIAGASLDSNKITLPAGEYFISANAQIYSGSEEHTSELQSHSDLVCRLLLEKKKNKQKKKK